MSPIISAAFATRVQLRSLITEQCSVPRGGGAVDGASPPNSRRPNAHGRASPLKEWEGRVNVGMSSTLRASIRESVQDMAIVRIKSTTMQLLSRPLIRVLGWFSSRCSTIKHLMI